MKKVVLTLAALALTAGSALAADLPSRKGPAVLPPPPPPPPLWTGFHVGLNAGAGWGNSNGQYLAVAPTAFDAGWPAGDAALASTQAAAFAAAASASVTGGNNVGFIGGGQIGYDWQFYGSFLAGLEADIQGIASSGGARSIITAVPAGDGVSNFVGVTSGRSNIQYLGTVRGRLGWLFLPTLLAYGTGGLAYAGVNLHTATSVTSDAVTTAGFGGVNFSNTQVGWTAGGGVEWMFVPNWSAKVEYHYYDLGTVTQNYGLVGANTAANLNAAFAGQARARVNGNIVRAGVNYHFNWAAAPVVAKF
jgi:outer membrane immunogenic protein